MHCTRRSSAVQSELAHTLSNLTGCQRTLTFAATRELYCSTVIHALAASTKEQRRAGTPVANFYSIPYSSRYFLYSHLARKVGTCQSRLEA